LLISKRFSAIWQPIDFDDYLAKSRLVRTSDRKVLIASPDVQDMIALDYEEQCDVHLEADEIGMPWSILCDSAWRR
jgi:hypothetical protein